MPNERKYIVGLFCCIILISVLSVIFYQYRNFFGWKKHDTGLGYEQATDVENSFQVQKTEWVKENILLQISVFPLEDNLNIIQEIVMEDMTNILQSKNFKKKMVDLVWMGETKHIYFFINNNQAIVRIFKKDKTLPVLDFSCPIEKIDPVFLYNYVIMD